MPKYVNTEELKNIIKSRYYTNYTETEIEDAQNDIVDFIIWDIDDMPGADVVEVKCGKWLYHTDDLECNLCHKYTYWETNYCPHCGAKMIIEDK